MPSMMGLRCALVAAVLLRAAAAIKIAEELSQIASQGEAEGKAAEAEHKEAELKPLSRKERMIAERKARKKAPPPRPGDVVEQVVAERKAHKEAARKAAAAPESAREPKSGGEREAAAADAQEAASVPSETAAADVKRLEAEVKRLEAEASAAGDPHLQNIHGERFDLMVPGSHILINIPRGERAENALLRVQADARRLGGHCADMYFQVVNITGAWAEKAQVGGLRFDVSDRARDQNSGWVILGPVGLKVVFGHTDQGAKYINVFAKHLGQAGFAVGGLLGEDDHEEASTPPVSCLQTMRLDRQAAPKRGGSWAVA